MNIKPQHIALIIILFLGGVIALLFFNNNTTSYLFSRSIDSEANTSIAEGAGPRPLVESLDGQPTEETLIDIEKQIQALRQELLETQNDPDKAIELRLRILNLQTKKEVSTSEENTASSQDL